MPRIRIALGALEVEYEGEQAFIEGSLLTLAERLVEIGKLLPGKPLIEPSKEAQNKPRAAELSTNTIAQIISAKTGSDLALAAIARVNIVKSQPTALRQEILDEMKQATTYYKDTFAGNLTNYLDTLVKGRRVNMVARSTYALAAAERSRLEAALAGGG